MKKALLVLGMVALAASVDAAEGVINFNNVVITAPTGGGTYSPGIWAPGKTGSLDANAAGTPGGAGGIAGGISVGLFQIGSTTPLYTAALFTTAVGPGFEWAINNGAATGDVSIPGSTPGQTPQLQVRAWETGKTWTTSTIRSLDTEGIFTARALGGPDPLGGPPISQPALTGFSGLVLVPEPSTYALGIAGLGALALMRRRK